MINLIEKGSFKLCKVNRSTNTIFNIIKKNLPMSIFLILGENFFNKLMKKKIINLFVVKNKHKISALISVVTVNNLLKLKYNIFFFFLINPFKFFFNFLKILKSLTRNSHTFYNSNYLYNLHLVIFRKDFDKITLKHKDYIFNFFFKKILKIFNAKTLFLCYENNNFQANKFWLRNKFLIYNRDKNIICVKKKLR